MGEPSGTTIWFNKGFLIEKNPLFDGKSLVVAAREMGWTAWKTSFYGGFLSFPHNTGSLDHLVERRPDPGDGADPLPEGSFDWREERGEYLSPVRYQGFCASCVAFAVTATVEITARWHQRNPYLPDLSEAYFFFSGETEHRCWKGWTLAQAKEKAKHEDFGFVPARACRYEPYNHAPVVAPGGECHKTIVKGWQTLDPGNHGPTLAVRDWLENTGPLVAQILCYPEFFMYRGGQYRRVAKYSNGMASPHYVCCVGYDDELQAYICRNSFGTEWGDQGYFHVAYDAVGIDACMWGVDGFTLINGERPRGTRCDGGVRPP